MHGKSNLRPLTYSLLRKSMGLRILPSLRRDRLRLLKIERGGFIAMDQRVFAPPYVKQRA